MYKWYHLTPVFFVILLMLKYKLFRTTLRGLHRKLRHKKISPPWVTILRATLVLCINGLLCVCSIVQLCFATPQTVAHQSPLSTGLSRQEYWSGLPFPSPGDLPDPAIEPGTLALQVDSLPSGPLWKPTLQPMRIQGWVNFLQQKQGLSRTYEVFLHTLY